MLDPKYIPLFLGGFLAWMAFVIGVGFFGSRGKREGEKFLTGGSDMNVFLIFCTLGATIIGTGSSIGAIGDIQFVIDKLSIDEDMMIIAGDNLFTYKLSDMYAFFKEKQHDTLISVTVEDVNQLRKLAVATINEDGKVEALAEKPKEPQSTDAVYATYMYLKETIPMIRQYLDEGNTPDAPGHFPSWLYTRKDVYVYRAPGTCIDIGTPENYKDVCDNYQKILGL